MPSAPLPVLLVGVLFAVALSACGDGCGRSRQPASGSDAATLPPMTLYDDFSAGALDPARWDLKDSLRGFADPLSAAHAVELTRQVEHGSLRLASTLEGETTKDFGTAVAHSRATFVDPSSIVALEATVAVRAVRTVGCAANPAFAFSRATIGGLFFNSGEPQPRSVEGDVLAVVGVGRRSDSSEPPDTLRALAVVLHCRRPCYAFAVHVPARRKPTEVLTMHDLGPVRVGQSTRLGLGWDEPADRFIFWRDGQVLHQLRYSLSDRSPPAIRRRHLDVAHFVPRCASGSAASASLDVSFDDVAVCVSGDGSSCLSSIARPR